MVAIWAEYIDADVGFVNGDVEGIRLDGVREIGDTSSILVRILKARELHKSAWVQQVWPQRHQIFVAPLALDDFLHHMYPLLKSLTAWSRASSARQSAQV